MERNTSQETECINIMYLSGKESANEILVKLCNEGEKYAAEPIQLLEKIFF